MSQTEPPAPTVADNLKPLTDGGAARVSLHDIIQKVEVSGGLAPVLLVLTLPVLLPLPPGFSMVLALPLLLAAPQMVVGRKDLWLPEKLARQSIARDKLEKGFARILPWVDKLEKLAHPRLTFLTGRIGMILAGVVCTLMAVVLILPLPFANLLPALTVCVLCLGLTRKDGVLVLAGFALLAAAVVAVVWGLHGARLGVDWLLHRH